MLELFRPRTTIIVDVVIVILSPRLQLRDLLAEGGEFGVMGGESVLEPFILVGGNVNPHVSHFVHARLALPRHAYDSLGAGRSVFDRLKAPRFSISVSVPTV
jgi:hypothetical protein